MNLLPYKTTKFSRSRRFKLRNLVSGRWGISTYHWAGIQRWITYNWLLRVMDGRIKFSFQFLVVLPVFDGTLMVLDGLVRVAFRLIHHLDLGVGGVTPFSWLVQTVQGARKHSNALFVNFPFQRVFIGNLSVQFNFHWQSNKIYVSNGLGDITRNNHIVSLLNFKTKIRLIGVSFLLILVYHF